MPTSSSPRNTSLTLTRVSHNFTASKKSLVLTPITVRIVADKRGVRGGKQYTSLLDRSFSAQVTRMGKCPKTGLPVVPVHYQPRRCRCRTGLCRGRSYPFEQMVAVKIVWTLACCYAMATGEHADCHGQLCVYSAYQKRRMPRGIMVIKSSNLETVERTAHATFRNTLTSGSCTSLRLVLKRRRDGVVWNMYV